MNTQIPAIVAVLCLGGVGATKAADFDDYARVVSVAPQVERFNQPKEECVTEYRQVQRTEPRGVGGALIGGVAGALLGSQVGKGNGRVAGAGVGAVAGAIVGDRIQNQNSGTTVTEEPVRTCRTVDNWQSRVNGYSVTYEYQGHTYNAVMPYDPGEKIRVRVSVAPKV